MRRRASLSSVDQPFRWPPIDFLSFTLRWIPSLRWHSSTERARNRLFNQIQWWSREDLADYTRPSSFRWLINWVSFPSRYCWFVDLQGIFTDGMAIYIAGGQTLNNTWVCSLFEQCSSFSSHLTPRSDYSMTFSVWICRLWNGNMSPHCSIPLPLGTVWWH